MVTLKRLTQWAATLHDCQSQHRLSVTERVHYLMALFHCMVRYGSARLGTVRVGLHFHRSLVPL